MPVVLTTSDYNPLLSTPDSRREQLSTLHKFLWVVFLPIADGGGNGHVARIGGFVVLRQFFGRAVAG
jgi:hypothetical protein